MTKPKAPGKGHNSKKKDESPVDVSKEIPTLAQRQLEADKKLSAAKAKHKDEHSAISGELKVLGIKRKNFNKAYDDWYLQEMAKDEKELREVRDEIVIDQAEYLQCYKALNKGKTLNFLDVMKQADKAKERVEASEKEGATEEVVA